MPNNTPIDYSLLIPELPAWNNGKGIDVDSWRGCSGNFQLAIAFSRLFWPEFVEHDGCVLFADFLPANYAGFMNNCKGDRAAVERVMNHQHILDLFFHAAGTATEAQVVYLGNVLKDILTVKLAHDFPARRFCVEFHQGVAEDLLEYEISFWQPANQLVR
jgi:hypothetical protein